VIDAGELAIAGAAIEERLAASRRARLGILELVQILVIDVMALERIVERPATASG
jgi:hypothetical protein